jgi:non-specific protein-tyrosine kinase
LPSEDGTSAREAYRVLRANVLVALADTDVRSVLITSALEGEGKTATCAGLAHALAMAGLRTIVVDLDLRHPDIHRWLGAHNEFGVAEVLLKDRTLERSLQLIEVGRGPGGASRSLYLLAAGSRVSNPTELLAAKRVAPLVEALSRQADIVLIDSPPVLPVADTLVIARVVGGAVLVVETRRTPVPSIQRAKDALIRNQTRLLGVVLNKIAARDDQYGTGYGYGYGDALDDGRSEPTDIDS